MTRRVPGSLGMATVAATGLVFLVLAVWGVARLDGELRLAAEPQRVEQRDLDVFEHRCPHPRRDLRRT